MLFKNANGQVNDVNVSKAALVILGPSPDGAESILPRFTCGEISGMMQWARVRQPANGSISLASWPGRQEACEYLHLDAGRASEVAVALLARLDASSTL